MDNELELSVNGGQESVSVAPEIPLLFVLRNELNLTGPRLGCGMAQCGACAVLLDGKEVRACITPISFAIGKKVTTIEGLPALWAEKKRLSPTDATKTLHPARPKRYPAGRHAARIRGTPVSGVHFAGLSTVLLSTRCVLSTRLSILFDVASVLPRLNHLG